VSLQSDDRLVQPLSDLLEPLNDKADVEEGLDEPAERNMNGIASVAARPNGAMFSSYHSV
jgi:hypothetical protein